MDLDEFIIAVFCQIDETLPVVLDGRRLRKRSPQPTLDDRKVLTMEVIGTYLGLTQDTALFAYFQRHWSHFFPALRQVHRTTFVRQAANLWVMKARLWQHWIELLPHDPLVALVDSVPLQVCQVARAYRCRRCTGEAAYGKDMLTRQTFYGFRLHVRLAWPGVMTRLCLAPANIHGRQAVPALVEQTSGFLVGDRNYRSPPLAAELCQEGVILLAPY